MLTNTLAWESNDLDKKLFGLNNTDGATTLETFTPSNM